MGSRLGIGLAAVISLVFLAGCGSAQKARLAERDKLIQHTGLMCDFVNGDEYQDVEIQLNLQIARKCDPSKNYTITNYKNASDIHGVLFCCSIPRKEDAPVARAQVKAQEPVAHAAPKVEPVVEAPKPPPAIAKPAAAPAPAAPAAEAPKANGFLHTVPPAPVAGTAAPAPAAAPQAIAKPAAPGPAAPNKAPASAPVNDVPPPEIIE